MGDLPDSAGLSLPPRPVGAWSPLLPAFAISQFDLYRKTETYEIFWHPEGGRKDALRWAAENENSTEKRSQNSKSIDLAANRRIRSRHRRNRGCMPKAARSKAGAKARADWKRLA